MRYTITLGILFWVSSCSTPDFISTSRKVEDKCVRKVSKWKGETFHDLRTKLYKMGRLNFINNKKDTLFFLESYEVEGGVYFGRIWNRKGKVEYKYNRGEFDFDNAKAFTNFMIDVVQRWDTVQIRNEERLNGNQLPERSVKAVKIINDSSRVKFDCILFKNFFQLERDRNG